MHCCPAQRTRCYPASYTTHIRSKWSGDCVVNLGYSAALHAGIYHTLLVPIVLLIALFSRFGYKFNKHLVTYLLTSSSTSFSTLAAMTVAVTLLAVFVIVAAYCSATAGSALQAAITLTSLGRGCFLSDFLSAFFYLIHRNWIRLIHPFCLLLSWSLIAIIAASEVPYCLGGVGACVQYVCWRRWVASRAIFIHVKSADRHSFNELMSSTPIDLACSRTAFIGHLWCTERSSRYGWRREQAPLFSRARSFRRFMWQKQIPRLISLLYLGLTTDLMFNQGCHACRWYGACWSQFNYRCSVDCVCTAYWSAKYSCLARL